MLDLLGPGLGRRLQHRGIEIRHTFAVGGRQRHRLAHAEREGVQSAGLAGLAFGLVGDQHHRLAPPAQHFGEHLVVRRHAFARVDHEQGQVGLVDGDLGLRLHAGLQALVVDVLKSGGVDQLQIDVAQPAGPETAVAGDAGAIVDDRQRPARQPVEQGRLADIGPSDDCDA